jgi:hypothetical protein
MTPPKLPSITPIDSTEHTPKSPKKMEKALGETTLGLEIHHGCFSFNQSCQVLTHGPSASVCPPVLQNMSALLDEAVRLDVDVSRPADSAA